MCLFFMGAAGVQLVLYSRDTNLKFIENLKYFT